MASYQSRKSSTSTSKSSPTLLQQVDTSSRRQPSTSTLDPSPLSSLSNPRVQLVPHSRSLSYDASWLLSASDLELLAKTSYDSKDVSSKDFDFEDVFTYDKPQRKLKSVVEVSRSNDHGRDREKEKDWSNFSFSHYQAASSARQKVNGRTRGELMMKARADARKR